jgi:hypothetical protein
MVSSTNLSDSGENDTTTRNRRRIGRAAGVLASAGAGLALVGVLSAGAVLGTRHGSMGAGSHTRTQAVAASHAQPQVAAGAVPAAAAAPATRGVAPAAVLYLVASQAQAAAAQADLDAAGRQATQLGSTPSDARVLLVASENDAAAERSLVVGENSLRASLGLAEIELVDLR